MLTKTTMNFQLFQDMKERQWFRMLYCTILSLVVVYVATHLWFTKNAFEFTQLSNTQNQQINKIYFNNTTLPSSNFDSLKSTTLPVVTPTTIQCDTDTSCNNKKCLRVLLYLKNEFNGNIERKQLDSICHYLNNAGDLEATSYLANFNFKIKSFFWLSESGGCYLEVIFWSILGVLCSIIYYVGQVIKNSTTDPANAKSTFDASEIPHSLAKLIYAPVCTLIIVLGYNLMKAQNPVEINSGKGLLVFAFIAGFYSSRLIAFLDRLRDLLLPNSGVNNLPDIKTPIVNTEKKEITEEKKEPIKIE